MALRLTGQLLLGVVRIYSRQVLYLFEDCNSALVKIQKASKPTDRLAVDLPPGRVHAPIGKITLPWLEEEVNLLGLGMESLGMRKKEVARDEEEPGQGHDIPPIMVEAPTISGGSHGHLLGSAPSWDRVHSGMFVFESFPLMDGVDGPQEKFDEDDLTALYDMPELEAVQAIRDDRDAGATTTDTTIGAVVAQPLPEDFDMEPPPEVATPPRHPDVEGDQEILVEATLADICPPQAPSQEPEKQQNAAEEGAQQDEERAQSPIPVAVGALEPKTPVRADRTLRRSGRVKQSTVEVKDNAYGAIRGLGEVLASHAGRRGPRHSRQVVVDNVEGIGTQLKSTAIRALLADRSPLLNMRRGRKRARTEESEVPAVFIAPDLPEELQALHMWCQGDKGQEVAMANMKEPQEARAVHEEELRQEEEQEAGPRPVQGQEQGLDLAPMGPEDEMFMPPPDYEENLLPALNDKGPEMSTPVGTRFPGGAVQVTEQGDVITPDARIDRKLKRVVNNDDDEEEVSASFQKKQRSAARRLNFDEPSDVFLGNSLAVSVSHLSSMVESGDDVNQHTLSAAAEKVLKELQGRATVRMPSSHEGMSDKSVTMKMSEVLNSSKSTRLGAARLFYETMVLSSKGYLAISQGRPYVDIDITIKV